MRKGQICASMWLTLITEQQREELAQDYYFDCEKYMDIVDVASANIWVELKSVGGCRNIANLLFMIYVGSPDLLFSEGCISKHRFVYDRRAVPNGDNKTKV